MSVCNMYEKMPQSLIRKVDNPNFHLHGIKLPARICVSAASGSGKSNLVVNFISLCSQGKGTFSKIQIVTKDASEALYDYLKMKSPAIQITEGLHTLPDLKTFDKDEQALVIIDDLCLIKDQSSVMQYFIRCRKCGVTVMYLSQSYYAIPLIARQNSNYLIVLGLGNKRSIGMMLNEVAIGASKEQLMEMFKYATKEKLHFLLVCIEESNPLLKFRKDFNEALDPSDFGVDK